MATAKFEIHLNNIIFVTTDTEPTMVATGRLIEEESRQLGRHTFWGGCCAHIFELTTGIAFNDTPLSDETMKNARSIVDHFSASTQASEALIKA